MAVPGFSVNELIDAAIHCKTVYDAFFKKNANTASQVRDLIDEINGFAGYLNEHKEVFLRRGLKYERYAPIERTLEQCRDFLSKYQKVLEAKRTASGIWRTARYPFVQPEVDRLRAMLQRHANALNQVSVMHLLDNSAPPQRLDQRQASSIPSGQSQNQPMTTTQPYEIGSSARPPAISQPYYEVPGENLQNTTPYSCYDGQSGNPLAQNLTELPASNVFQPVFEMDSAPAATIPSFQYSPQEMPSSQPISFKYSNNIQQTSYEMPGVSIGEPVLSASPISRYGIPSGSSSAGQISRPNSDEINPINVGDLSGDHTDVSAHVNPQAALDYVVCKLYYGKKGVKLQRKPTGRDYTTKREYGRELVIIDENNNTRLKHQIMLSSKRPCYPYTWSRNTSHDPLEITFKGIPPENHTILFLGKGERAGTPIYVFTKASDFRDFQSEVRGKDFIDAFEVNRVTSSTSGKYGDASDQHLKIWKDRKTLEFSISFYASILKRPMDLEFPIRLIEKSVLASSKKGRVELKFNVKGGEPQSPVTPTGRYSTVGASYDLGRSDTVTTANTERTTSAGSFTFSRRSTSATMDTVITAPSRTPSIAPSFASGASAGSDEGSGSGSGSGTRSGPSSLEKLVAKMKYLKLDFSDEAEAARFRAALASAFDDEAARPLDLSFENVDWDTSRNRPMSDAGFSNYSVAAGSRSGSVYGTSPGTPGALSPQLRPLTQRDRAASGGGGGGGGASGNWG